ncbi:CDP-diacylglycerol--glycerol-3-phosphate 3-phosphatidyltransferase [Desulfarculales bacterium]
MIHQEAPKKGASVEANARTEPDPAGQGEPRKERPSDLAARIVDLVPQGITPNHLTILRMVGTLIILPVGFSQAHLGWIVALGLISGLSDNLDGMVARVRGQVTALGAVLDPLADKLFAAVIMVVLWRRGLADWRLLLLAASMDLHALLIPLLVFLLRWLRGRPIRPVPRVEPNIWGKLKTGVLAWSMGFIIMGHTFDQPWMATLGTTCIWVSIGLGLVAMAKYFAAFCAGKFD